MIIIHYPPNFDGELHINVENIKDAYKFEFTHTSSNGLGWINTKWDTLVLVAKAILAQDLRRNPNK